MPVPQMKVGRAIRLGILELALFLLGILLVRREIWQLHSTTFTIAHWQQGLLISLSAIDGALTGAYASRRRNVEHLPAYKNVLKWGTPLFFVLYVGCCAVCERLSVGIFPVSQVIADLIRTLGLALIVSSLGLRIWSQNSAPEALMIRPVDPLNPPAPAALKESEYPHFAERHVESKDDTQERLQQTEEPSSPKDSEDRSAESATCEPDEHTEPAVNDLETPVLPATDLESSAGAPEASATDPEVTPTELMPVVGQADESALIPDEVSSIFPTGPHKILRYPDASARLVGLIGLPLVFNCWLPILALPGIVVLLKWHISDREAFRISQLGEPYLQYRTGTWNLIPFIY